MEINLRPGPCTACSTTLGVRASPIPVRLPRTLPPGRPGNLPALPVSRTAPHLGPSQHLTDTRSTSRKAPCGEFSEEAAPQQLYPRGQAPAAGPQLWQPRVWSAPRGGGEVSPPWAAQSAHGSGVWPLQTQPLTLLSPEDTGRHEALLCQQTDG